MSIRIHANAVLRVLDGFTGQPLPPSVLRCTVDGAPFRPIGKAGGYYILTDLPPGEHQVNLQAPRYAGERLTVPGGSGAVLDALVTMKPGTGYPLGAAATWLILRVVSKEKGALSGWRIWIAARDSRQGLRIAQEAIRKGDMGGWLCGPASDLPLPRDFLLLDGERSEICRVAGLEEPQFAAPLAWCHKRDCRLFPAQVYTASEAGEIRAAFREPMPVELLAEGEKRPVSFDLRSGINEFTLSLREKK